ncbi:MAG TPA: 2'-5' RNA ligase family protein [Candidatus Dojkabacteria bacterium]|nr:2'-5' RNA ligase family protein [Candidatus Dojkabacteria bacterium]
MSIFLGFFPDNKSNNEIASVAEDVKEIFDDLGIKVRWSNPCTYHSTLLFLGKSSFPLKVFIIKNKLKKFQFKKFKVKFNSVKLGISRQYRELIFLDFLEGGEEMRVLYLELKKIIGDKGDINFIPHLTLGRVNKDLSAQESANIIKDLTNVSKKMNVNEIAFEVSEIKLVESEDGKYSFLLDVNSD